MDSTKKLPAVIAPELADTRAFETETDAQRRVRNRLAHRKAVQALACVTLRYQVHNELFAARSGAQEEYRDSETRLLRARSR